MSRNPDRAGAVSGSILVVDDDKALCHLYREQLERQGFDVVTALSYQTALECLKTHEFETILSDIMIGDHSGIDLLKYCVSAVPDVPVLLITGVPSLETAVEALKLGAYDYLAKPVVKNELVQSIRRAVEVYKLRKEKKHVESENEKYRNQLEKLVTVRTKKLKEQNEFLENVVESLTHPFYVIDVKSRQVVMANSAAEFGELHLNNTCHLLTHKRHTPCSDTGHQCPLDTVVRTGKPAVVDHMHIDSQGGKQHAEIHGYPILDKYGNVVQMIEYALDVTDRKKAENELVRRGKILECARYAAETCLKTSNWEEIIHQVLKRIGKTIDVSRVYIIENAAATTDKSIAPRHEWTNTGIIPKSTVMGEKDAVSYAAGFKKWCASLKRGALVQGSQDDFHGTERSILISHKTLSTVMVGIFVKHTHWGCIGFDECRTERQWSPAEINALKVIAQTLGAAIYHDVQNKERSRLATAIKQSADSIIIMNPEGVVEYVNPAYESITGYHREAVLGSSSPLLDKSGGSHENHDEIWHQLQQGHVWHGCLNNKKKDGTLLKEEATISPVKDDKGNIINYVAIQRDITERQQLESIAEAANLMDNLGYIFAGIRHEIGNPLNSIKMALTVLYKNIKIYPLHTTTEFLERTLGEVARMEYLLKAFKNFSLYESPEIQTVNIRDFITKFIALVQDDFNRAGIELTTRMPRHHRYCYGDPRMLHQVLLNLYTNAADALEKSENPGIVTEIRDAGGYITIDVTDNGCGISKSEKARIFTPFYTTKARGTGLGLVIVKKMLIKMNAGIEMISEKNTGTTVSIKLPEAMADE
ncbi:MAG: PAS domain S-box protein [Desulfobacteraceae bacterium]|nr:PAS domain S-box protein [Desulfobacteraceae bacterium]